jgi:glycosyltransferase involved in cell wall biosynthesis
MTSIEQTLSSEPRLADVGAESIRSPDRPLSISRVLAGRKVVIIVENLPVPFDRRVWLEARTLKNAGAEVSVICPKGKGYEAAEEQLDGIRIYRHDLPPEGRGALGYLREYSVALFHEARLAWRLFLTEGVDVIHACNPPDLIFLVALPLKLFGCKLIFDHHDINPELYEAKFARRGVFWRLMIMFERLTFMSADVTIATNNSYRGIAVGRNKKSPENVFVVRSGPDVDKLRPTPPNPALKRGRRYLLGYVGVIGDQEGVDLLLRSMQHLVYDLGRTDIQLTLAGSGPSLRDLQELAVELKVTDYVAFLGRVSNSELFELLSTADVCVNPDRVTAMNDLSTMNKIMEYMAFAKPIVQFDVREGRYSAQGASVYAKANDIVDFAEKIVELLADEDRRIRMGQFGRERVEKALSWQTQAPNLIAAYEKVLEGKQPRVRSAPAALEPSSWRNGSEAAKRRWL